MVLRLTTFQDIHDEFYYPTGLKSRERRSMRQVGYDMGKRGVPVTPDFLSFRARLYNGQLNAATHTIDQRAEFVSRRTGDALRNLSLFVLAVAGIIIVTLAMMVDYKILHDFWTVVYSNEFLEVPESLKDNVAFKSLQVLFAVIALHFLISQSGWLGSAVRGVFMVATGVMVIGMLVGLGFLSTKTTLPTSASIAGKDITRGADTRSGNDALLESLGLRGPQAGPTGEASAAPTGTLVPSLADKDFNEIETLVFFGTFGLIFLFVSSVGALCLHYSLHALQALFGGTDSERREHALAGHHYFFGRGEWRPKTRKDLDDQRYRIKHASAWIADPDYRTNLMDRFLAEFAAGYMDGLMDRMHRSSWFGGQGNREEFDQLRDDMRYAVEAASGEWSRDRIEATIPNPEVRRVLGGYRPLDEKPQGLRLPFLGGFRRQGPNMIDESVEPAPAPKAEKVIKAKFGETGQTAA